MACLTSSGDLRLTKRYSIGSVKPEIQDFNYHTTENTASQSQRKMVNVVQGNSSCFVTIKWKHKNSLRTKYLDF
jgi:hypothetical protein